MKKLLISALLTLPFLTACGDGLDQTSDSSATFNPALIRPITINPTIRCFLVIVPAEIQEAEQKVLDQTNAFRARNGLAALKSDVCASNVARAHSQNMIAQNNYNHVLNGKGPLERAKEGALNFKGVWENIHNWAEWSNNAPVWNYGAYPDRAMGFWTTSPAHKANLLNPSITHIGIGVAKGQQGINGTLAGTQLFLQR